MELKPLVMIIIIALVMIALTPVIFDAIYNGVLTCIETNTTPLSVDCNNIACGSSVSHDVLNEVNDTVITGKLPATMFLAHNVIANNSEHINQWNSSSNVNTTLTRDLNYTINLGTGLVTFTTVINGTFMESVTNYSYLTITGNPCCAVCVTGTSKTLLQLIPFIYVGLVILGSLITFKIKFG
jgi:hypothetical protein